jgi:hypothetical protein
MLSPGTKTALMVAGAGQTRTSNPGNPDCASCCAARGPSHTHGDTQTCAYLTSISVGLRASPTSPPSLQCCVKAARRTSLLEATSRQRLHTAYIATEKAKKRIHYMYTEVPVGALLSAELAQSSVTLGLHECRSYVGATSRAVVVMRG